MEETMTKKDYELIAATIRKVSAVLNNEAAAAVRNEFKRALVATNPKFNPERFLAACN
jgi:hypothetical protein